MLRKEDKYYIDILKDFVHKNKTNELKDIDWSIISEYARTQNTNGIIFYQCKDFIPKEYLKQLSNNYAAEIYDYGRRISITKQIVNKFVENNIDYFIIKGPVVATYYPVEALRTMGDTDFVVHDYDLDKACKIMLELGYTALEGEKEKAFFKDGKEVEIHTHLIYPSINRKQEEIDLCDRCWDYVKNNQLDETFHFMYLMLHLKKHLFGIGVGIRHFLDLAIIMNKTNIDFDFIDTEFSKLNLLDYKNTCLTMISKWFGVGEELVHVSDDFYNEQTIEILKNGVHGFENEENKLNGAFKRLSGIDNKLSTKNKLNYLLDLFFPNYESLIKQDKYKFIENKEYLLPLAWVYRFVLSIVDNKAGKRIKETKESIFLSKDIMDKKQKARDNWGL